MKTEKRTFPWLATILIFWNIVDIAVHIAVDMVEALRIGGNVIGILIAIIVMTGILKSKAHDALLGSALAIIVLNSVFAFQNGGMLIQNSFLPPMLVFVGVTLFLMIRLAQVKRREMDLINGNTEIRVVQRWWVALVLTFVGVAIVGVFGMLA